MIFDDEETATTSIKLEFLDIPGFYHYLDGKYKDLFNQLSTTDQFDYF
jgi:hypothetical protein